MSDVVVLLSTWNGERWLREQLDSILAQTARPRVVVRDDGSRDGTVALLRAYAAAHPGRIAVGEGPNLGPTGSFLTLLRDAPPADWYAFADQDDRWHPDKLARAIARIADERAPALACGRLHLVDGEGRHLGWSAVPRRLGFGCALAENVVTGCTVVINRAARDLAVAGGIPDGRVVIHDWWLYLVLSAFGVVRYDPRPAIDYRLHGGNAVGLARNRAQLWAKRLATLGRRRWQGLAQAQAFLAAYGDRLPAEHARLARRFVAAFADRDGRWALAFDRRVRRQHPLDDLAMRALVAAGARI